MNIIFKKTYQGASITADGGTSSHGDGTTAHASAIFGRGDLVNDGHNCYIEGEYRHQQQIRFTDRGGIYTQTDYTSSGGLKYARRAHCVERRFGAKRHRLHPRPRYRRNRRIYARLRRHQIRRRSVHLHDTWDQIQPETTNIILSDGTPRPLRTPGKCPTGHILRENPTRSAARIERSPPASKA